MRPSAEGGGKTPQSGAGLPLSVGQARLPLRMLIALVATAMTIVVATGGRMIAHRGARILAIALVEPLAVVGAIATIFILAPHSRFGDWLDRFVVRLAEPCIAIVTAAAIWIVSALITVD